jgi:hypothetical protein
VSHATFEAILYGALVLLAGAIINHLRKLKRDRYTATRGGNMHEP